MTVAIGRKLAWMASTIRGTCALGALALACAPPGPEGTRAVRETASAAAEALDRARACAEDLGHVDGEDARAMARELAIDPLRLSAFRGTRGETDEIHAAVAERLELVRQNAAAARSLARIEEWEALRRAEDRALRAIKVADQLCRAASALPPERVAQRRAGRSG